MSTKIEIIKQSLVITDSVAGVLLDVPKSECYYIKRHLIEDSIINFAPLHAGGYVAAELLTLPTFLLGPDVVDGADSQYTIESFKAFAQAGLGFKTASGGSGANLLGSDTIANILAKDPSNIGDAWVALDSGVDDAGTAVTAGEALASDGIQWTNIGQILGEQGDTGATGAEGPIGPEGPAGPAGIDGEVGSYTIVNIYSELPTNLDPNSIAFVLNDTGTAWLPGSLGGTYYPSGWYMWLNSSWVSDTKFIDNQFNTNKDLIAINTSDLIAHLAAHPAPTIRDSRNQVAGTYSEDIHSNIVALNAVLGVNTGDQVIPVSTIDFDPVGTDNSNNNAVNTNYANDYRAANFVAGINYQVPLIADTNYLTPSTASTTYALVLGVDDNYVTDAQLVVLGNTSGVNTGDQTLPVTGIDFDPVGTDNSDNNAVNTTYANDYRAANFVSGIDYEPAKGVDDNYVTDAEKVVVGNTSGTNTGDETTATIQTKRPLKTVNGSSLEGSGNIVISGSADVVVEDLVVTGTKNIDWSSGDTFRLTVTGAVVLSDLNLPSAGTSKIITLHVNGDFALTLPTGWDTNKTGTYDGTVLNTITVEYVNTTTPFHKVTIIQ